MLANIRPGATSDKNACVALWVNACAVRDGRAIAGVPERASAKFDSVEGWVVAEGGGVVSGFALATPAGTGLPTDPPSAPVIGLLAVDPNAQRSGLGTTLLNAICAELELRGHDRAVLHVLVDNVAAVRLYESSGWVASGEPHEHVLLKRPFQTYVRTFAAAG
jgi:ribosomal protein S18 acetylase RimI-like enzyme